MTKFTLMGILSFLGGGLLLGFEALSVLMGAEGGWKSKKLVTIFDEGTFDWIDNASFFGLEKVADYLVNSPLFLLLFGIGILFFAMDYFFGKR